MEPEKNNYHTSFVPANGPLPRRTTFVSLENLTSQMCLLIFSKPLIYKLLSLQDIRYTNCYMKGKSVKWHNISRFDTLFYLNGLLCRFSAWKCVTELWNVTPNCSEMTRQITFIVRFQILTAANMKFKVF
jgi:hypothetical protein